MNIRDFYINCIRDVLGISSVVDFSVKFFYELGRAESNVAIKVANFNPNFSSQNCFEKFRASSEFSNSQFLDNGMFIWIVPDIIWYNHLVILNDELDFFKIPKDSLNLNEDDLFELRYVYARICSVFRHYNKWFPADSLNSIHEANLHLISRQDIIRLVRTMVAFTLLDLKKRNQVNVYIRGLSESFNKAWSESLPHEELGFITLANITETKSRLAVLNVLKRMLLKFFKTLGVDAQEELV